MSFSQEGNDASSSSTIITAEALEGWKTATTQIETLLNPKTLMATFWNSKTRPDGRLLTQTRPTSIQTDIFLSSSNNNNSNNNNNNNIVGSALVRLGGTHVLAAVSLLVGQCTSAKTTTTATTSSSSTDHDHRTTVARGGDIVVLVSTPESGGGGGGDNNRDAQAECYLCQSFLQRILHETMDLEQLLIDTSTSRKSTTKTTATSGPNNILLLAFRLQVTVRVLQNQGNIIDAALLASVAALQQSQLPTNLQFDDNNFGKVVAWNFENPRSLQMPLLPVPLSMGTIQINKHDDQNDDDDNNTNTTRWIVDPTRAEQDVLQNALTVVVNAREPHQVLAVEFNTAGAGISTTDLGVAVHMATARAVEVQSLFQIKI